MNPRQSNPLGVALVLAGTIAAVTVLLVFGVGMFLLGCVFAALIWLAVVLDQRDDALTDYIAEVFTNAELKADVERLNFECDALHQENCQLHDELAQARLWAGDGPRLRVVRDDTPPVDDDAWFARLYDERGNVR